MSLSRRIDDVEDHHLTPKEAVICWIREAHQFESLLTYGRWLLEQPEEAYPLIRMPRQVVDAVRAQNKGTSDALLRDEFYRVQKDVTFLYHLHKQVNVQALQDEEALRLKVTLLSEKLRSLIYRVWAIDALRVERLQFPDDMSAPRPKRRRKKMKDELDLAEAIAAWPVEEQMLWGEVMAFQEAVQLISRRYLGGEELLFPQSAERLQATLHMLAVTRDVYRTMNSRRPPKSEERFLRWVLEESTPESPVPPALSPDPAAEKRPDTRATARSLAEHHVLMARAEALEALGERDASIRLVENWLRSRD
jgi:hypothetical protein